MSETTPRMLAPFPSRETDPWFDAFVDYVNAVDSSQYAYREDRNSIFSGGGTLSWNATTGVLSWDAPISILAAVTGYLWQITAGSDVIDSTEGIIFYATLDRGPGSNTNVAIATINKLGSISPDNVMVIAVRIGTTLYFRTGLVLEDGATATGIAPGGGGGVEGLVSSIETARYDYVQGAVPVEEVVGQFMFDGSKIPSGASVRLRCQMNPTFSVAGFVDVRFYDLGAPGAAAAPVAITGASPYQLRLTISGLNYLETDPLTTHASTPAVGRIVEAKRMYEVTVIQSSAVADDVDLGFAGIYTEA